MKLTDEQLAIINSNEQKILVKAGAGTGKTEVLTRRIIRLIDENQDLSIKDIAIITFTNKATEVLQSRLKKVFYEKWKQEKNIHKKMRFRYELESLNSAQITTIHKFCASILETIGPYYDDQLTYSPAYKTGFNSLTKIIDQTIENWIKQKRSKNTEIEHLKYMPVYRLKEIVKNSYELIRRKGLDIHSILDGTRKTSLLEETTQKKLKTELKELLQKILETHQKFKYGQIDADDLLIYCFQILKDRPDLCQEIQKKYKHIFIDEFQDTSLYQSEIVKLICDDSRESPHLFLVGDIKQSIYEFRGADTDAYNKIERWIQQNGSVLSLSTNWRSEPEIVYYVNFIFDRIQKNEKYNFKTDPLQPNFQKNKINMSNAYEWLFAEKGVEQSELIAQYLKKQRDQNQFTILVRKNYELHIIAERLNKYSIPFTIIDGGQFYKQREIIEVYRVLKTLIQKEDSASIQEAQATIFFQNQTYLFNQVIDEIKLNQLIYKLTPSQLIDYLYKKTAVFERCTSQVKANLNKLKEITRRLVKDENISLYHYVNWLAKKIISDNDESLADSTLEKSEKTVQLMTIHKAKGLEFPIVILPHLDQDISKNALNPEITIYKNQFLSSLEFNYQKYRDDHTVLKSTHYTDTIEEIQSNVYSEELRILYVALTRAQKKLILCGNKSCPMEKECFQNWLKNG